MIISSEIENVEKVENLREKDYFMEKSILRAFARTRAKKFKKKISKLCVPGYMDLSKSQNSVYPGTRG